METWHAFGNYPDVKNILDICRFCVTITTMTYSIETTDVFDKWFTSKIKDIKIRARIISRFDRILMGNVGDYRHLDENLYELRFFFGSGLRIYFTIWNQTIVLLLCGGDKSSQARDIQKAKQIMEDQPWV